MSIRKTIYITVIFLAVMSLISAVSTFMISGNIRDNKNSVNYSETQQDIPVKEKGIFFENIILKLKIISIITFLVNLIFLYVITLIIMKKIVHPIGELKTAMISFSEGDLKSQISYKSNNELGQLSESMCKSINNINMYVSDIARAMSEMSNGNFDIEPSQPFIGDFKSIENSITKFVVVMSHTISNINNSADIVLDNSIQTSNVSQMLAQGATKQASSVEELSASIEEISVRVKDNALNSNKANELAAKSSAAIENSNEQMKNLMAAMNDIHSKSSEISQIIKAIEDIAFQTNILAINASIEAAHAGTAGKGFAVVADEVRSLAGKSSEAAKNTNDLINSSVNSVNEGMKIAKITATNLSDVVKTSALTADIIRQISDASSEQASSLEQIAIGVDQIAEVVQNNSATSQESAASSEGLSEQANALKQLISNFKIKNLNKLSS